MKPVLRRFLVTAATVVALGVLAIGWITSAFLFSPCEYALMRERVSPSERYVAEIYSASCGLSGSRSVVMLRDRSALRFARVDETPPGTVVANDFAATGVGEDLIWEGETKLVLLFSGAQAPRIVSAEWGGVRIEARQVHSGRR